MKHLIAKLCLLLTGLCVSIATFAQTETTVKGTVYDSDGLAVVGATVQEKGSGINATVTDMNGNFELQTSQPDATLIVKFIGYETQEVSASGGNVTVTLESDLKEIDEVVVVGYGTQRKANLTGSVSALDSKEIADIPAANSASLLQGRLSGVVLTSPGGQAGNDMPEIRIRGIGTLSDNNDPMVLIDGVEASVSQFAQLAAADIDNVSVLKDAASASIYGVRAANGVILVTTKRGTEGTEPTVNYSGSFSLQSATRLPDYVNSYEWAKMYNESNDRETYTADMLQKLKDGSDPDHFANTDWADELFRTAPMTQHNLSISGGGKAVAYMFSVGYLYQEGILRETDYTRINFRSNIDATVKRLKFGLNLSGSKEDKGEPASDITGENGLMRMLSWFTRPTVAAKYSNGYYGCVDGSSISQSVFKNPLQAMTEGNKTNDGYRFDGKFTAELSLVKGLKFRTSLAYKLYINDTSSYSAKSSKYDADGNVLYSSTTNSLYNYRWKDNTFLNENIFTYANQFGAHDLNILAGHSTQQYREDVDTQYRENFATDNLYEMNAGTANDQVSGYAQNYNLQSFFGRVGYNYDQRYLFEFNIRHDGSSRMPKSHRYATFPSFSAGWVVTGEDFMESAQSWLDYLKIRASWGKLGNQEIGNYPYTATMSANYNYYFGSEKVIGMAEDIVANDDIKWETTAITDIGLDAAFWENRINLTFDYFNKETSDILLQLSMPTTFLGSLGAPYQNAGEVRNRGWELGLNYNDRHGDWSWNASVSLSAVKNKIIDNKGIDTYGYNTINREGNPIGSYYGLRAIGIYRTQADLDRVNANGDKITQNGAAPQLGDIMYEDVDGNGNIDSDDRVIIGNPFPKMTYSFSVGAKWKGIDLTCFWQGQSGVYRYNWSQATITNGGNMSTRWLDRWSEDNPGGSMPRLGNSYNEAYSSFWLDKADYLRLKNLELGYTFGRGALDFMGIESMRIYVQSTNLITITDFHDYDPEKSSSDTRADAHPNAKTFSFGVNVKF